MGNSDAETPTKPAKTSSAQEQPPSGNSSSATVYPDWSGFPAYSPIPPHGFFPSPVASSPQAHSYIWGTQHMMPPYGTPPPYVMYPHGGLYAHPSLPPGTHPFSPYAVPTLNGNLETSGATPGGSEVDGKSAEGKEKSSMKRSKGSLGSLNMITGKNNIEHGKSGTPANGVLSQSGEGESGSEDSSEGSDANSQNDSQIKNGGQDTFEDHTQNGISARSSQNGVARPPSQAVIPIMPLQATSAPTVAVGPTTNLNIGMDYWSAPNPSPIVPIYGKVSDVTGVGGLRENIPADAWLQDERELKRQRRKQSNRESARRSRLRKQGECEELAQRVEVLKEENDALKAELNRVKKEYQQLVSDNTSLKEKYEIHRRTDEARVERSDRICGDDKCHKQTDSDIPEGQDDAMKSH